MNGERLQRIVEEIISRLQRRAESTVTQSVAQLRDADMAADAIGAEPGLIAHRRSNSIVKGIIDHATSKA